MKNRILVTGGAGYHRQPYLRGAGGGGLRAAAPGQPVQQRRQGAGAAGAHHRARHRASSRATCATGPCSTGCSPSSRSSARDPLRRAEGGGRFGGGSVAYYDNNVHGSLVLAAAMQAAGVRTLIFSSSATVYGEPGPLADPRRRAAPAGQPLWPLQADGRGGAGRPASLGARPGASRCCATSTRWARTRAA